MYFIYKKLAFNNFYSLLIPNLLRKFNSKYNDYLIDFSHGPSEYILNLKDGGFRKFIYEGIVFSFEKFEDGATIHYTLNEIDKINECIIIII